VFTREICLRLLAPAGMQSLVPLATSFLLTDWWLMAHDLELAEGRRTFDFLVLATSWIFWKERNNRTFDGFARTMSQVLAAVTDELHSYVAAGFRGLAAILHLLS
jgi:hypothetical protein